MKEKRHKIITRVSERDYARLERIVKAYGFRSVYALFSYLSYCFLRVVDKEHDDSDAVLPEEIVRMFPISEDAGDVYRAVRMIRRHKRQGRCREPDLFEHGEVEKTVSGMFGDAQDAGRKKEFADNLRKRSER